MTDPYLLLDLQEDADEAAIRAAYRRYLREHPPEGDPAAFQAGVCAYEVLQTPERRAEHRLFGNVIDAKDMPLAGLAPDRPGERTRIGMARWLNYQKEHGLVS
jgi:DnaJ-class molecular chaperone